MYFKKKYIEGYNDFINFSEDQLRIIANVRDSLKASENRLNKMWHQKTYDCIRHQKKSKNIQFVLFFSELIENKLYAEVLPMNPVIEKNLDFKDLAYGEALTNLFIFDKKCKVEYLNEGNTHYN